MIYMFLSKSRTKCISNLFSKCSELKQIAIPPNITEIGPNCFSECPNLTRVSIPSSVTSIGNQAFEMCGSLNHVSIPSSVTSIGQHAFSECSWLTKIAIPPSIEVIGSYAFYQCYNLTQVSIPSSVTSIGKHAFSGCISLTKIAIPPSIQTIEPYTFNHCLDLKEVTLPKVESICEFAFCNCSTLEKINIPPSVKTINENAFKGCYLLPDLCPPDKKVTTGIRPEFIIAIFIYVFAFICLSAEFIVTIVWWTRIHPWFAHGYKIGKIVYVSLEICWISYLLNCACLAVYFLVRSILKRHKNNGKAKKINNVFTITAVIVFGLISVVAGMVASSYALKNEKINGEKVKCLKYVFEGSQGASDWVANQSLKKQNDFQKWYSKMLTKAFKKDGKISNYYCIEVGIPGILFPCILILIMSYILFILLIDHFRNWCCC